MAQWNVEKAIALIEDTSKCVIPRRKRSQQAKVAPNPLDRGSDLTLIALHIGNAKKKVVHVEEEEQQEHRQAGFECTKEHHRGEYKPCLGMGDYALILEATR